LFDDQLERPAIRFDLIGMLTQGGHKIGPCRGRGRDAFAGNVGALDR